MFAASNESKAKQKWHRHIPRVGIWLKAVWSKKSRLEVETNCHAANVVGDLGGFGFMPPTHFLSSNNYRVLEQRQGLWTPLNIFEQLQSLRAETRALNNFEELQSLGAKTRIDLFLFWHCSAHNLWQTTTTRLADPQILCETDLIEVIGCS